MAHWIQKATKRMKEKGTEGSFTRIAHRMGKSTKAAANYIHAHPDDFSAATRKKANFARNVAK